MMPRPASRRRPVDFVPPDHLAAAVKRIRADNGEPAAVVSGVREWQLVRAQPEARVVMQFWPWGDETFMDVPVIIVRGFGAPRVFATQRELEDALLGRED